MQPILPTTGAPVDPNSYTGALTVRTPNQTSQPTENTFENILSVFQTSTVEFFDGISAQATRAFNNFFFEQPSLLILPKDMIHRIFIGITKDKDLCSFTLTCKALHALQTSPQIQKRIFEFRIMNNKQLNEKSIQLILAINDRSFSHSESISAGIPPIV